MEDFEIEELYKQYGPMVDTDPLPFEVDDAFNSETPSQAFPHLQFSWLGYLFP